MSAVLLRALVLDTPRLFAFTFLTLAAAHALHEVGVGQPYAAFALMALMAVSGLWRLGKNAVERGHDAFVAVAARRGWARWLAVTGSFAVAALKLALVVAALVASGFSGWLLVPA